MIGSIGPQEVLILLALCFMAVLVIVTALVIVRLLFRGSRVKNPS